MRRSTVLLAVTILSPSAEGLPQCQALRDFVICQRFDAENNESAFLVFHIFDVEAGPAAVLPLVSPVHLGFHAVFHPRESNGPRPGLPINSRSYTSASKSPPC